MNKKEIESTLKDYHWMLNSIKLLRQSMKDAGENMTAQYGEEAGMPKAQGGKQSDPVLREVKRREKRWNVVYTYESKVKSIQDRMHRVQEQRECEVLHWLLEGKSLAWIGRHMGLSDKHISRLKGNIITQMSDMSETSDMSDYRECQELCL
ncbi:helix-turn-helix transcriptional regulator [Alkalicoccus luteus]|uniref:DNA-binding response regulator n=1 Tax=Alkalicoccus luteus TaxID=1237094 RepID=A0A969PPB6_9BACI|nr:LuxR C-terminal-related transcriptional regulator [Alkalicoccus luteus]NJP37910.1 DNA-binding response regulator [Alkalicoccus luteus]